MPTLKTKTAELYYEVSGQGEPLVMLRGLGRSLSHWLGFDRQMAERFKVITVDPVGIGRSRGYVPWYTSVFDLAGNVISVLNHLDVDAAHIMGVSLGGMITLAAGIKYPGRSRSLTVINASVFGGRSLRLTPRAVMAIARSAMKPDASPEYLFDVLVSSASAEERQEIMQAWREIDTREGLDRLTVLKHLLAAASFSVRHELSRLEVPTLVLYGRNDRFVSPKNSEAIYRMIQGARLVGIEGGGHELTIDRPQEVRDEMLKFFATLTETPRVSQGGQR